MGYLNNQLKKKAALKLLATAARKIPAGIRAGARGLNTVADKLQPMMRSGVSTMNTLHHIRAGFQPEQLRTAAHAAGMAGHAAAGTLGGVALGKYLSNYITNPTGGAPAAPHYWRG